jgi:hypothetical protein
VEAVPVQKKKRYVGLSALAAVFLFVALAPYLLSTGAVLRLVVGAFDKRLPGALSVDSWLVGWQQGILCQQVDYVDEQRGIRLHVPRLTSTRGLLALVFAPDNLGLLVADSPRLEINAAAPASPGGPGKLTDIRPAGLTPYLNTLVADLEIRDGQATVALADPSLTTGVRNLSLSATFASGVVIFTLAVRALHDKGSARITGSLNLPASGQGGMDTLVADARLAVNGLQLRDLLTVAGKNAVFPMGEGLFSTELQFKAVGLAGLQASGHAEFEELNLRGGILGGDTPSFAKMRLDIDGGKWAASGWSVRQLVFASDTADFTGTGRHDADGFKLAGKGRINLPVLFAQFPRLFLLRETSLVESGTVDVDLDLDLTGERRRLDLKASADAFSGLAGDHAFAWPGPFSLLVNGETAGEDFRVNALKVETPFFQADGRGDLHSFVFDAHADLAQAFADVGQVFMLGWDGAGHLDLEVKGKKDSDDDQRINVATDLEISDFALSRADELIVPRDHFSLLGSVNLPPSIVAKGVGAFDLQFALSSWLGESFLTLYGEKQAGRPFHGSYSTDTSLDLASATGLLHVLKFLPGTASVTGDLQIQAAGNLRPDELEVREFAGQIDSLTLVREDASFAEQKVRLEVLHSINEEIKVVTAGNLIVADSREKFFRTGAGSNVVNHAGHSLFLHNLGLTSATGTCQVVELLVPDWRSPLAGLEADLTGTFDLAQLSGLLRWAGALTGASDIAGSGQAALRAEANGEGGQETSAELRLQDVNLVREKKKVPVSKELRLDAHFAQQARESDIEIRELRLHSDPLQVEGTGTIRRSDNRQVIDLQGKLTPALEQASAVLRDGFGIDLRLAGGQSESFLAQFPLAGRDENIPTASLATSLHADRLEYQGIAVRSLHMPLSLKNNELHLEVTGQLAEGKLAFIADTDLAGEFPVITVPANREVLTGVQVQPLLDGLLAFLHPLFGVLAMPSGRIDLGIDSFAWPLGGEQGKEATFVMVTDLRELSLESGKILREILTLFHLDKEQLALRDTGLLCSGLQGRVTCDPLKVQVGEAELAISGSVGLDGTLDYLLEVPVTGRLAGEESYRFLQGATIGVAVRGTVKAPDFDREKTKTAVKELLRQAASKLRQEKDRKPSAAGESETVSDRKG